MNTTERDILFLDHIDISQLAEVGGKNASLGEMIGALSKKGVKVPGGFVTTASAFQRLLAYNQLPDRIAHILDQLDVDNIEQLQAAGRQIRSWVMEAKWPQSLTTALAQAYEQLTAQMGDEVSFAVRSSATAEDLPEASFAGQQETFLNIRGLAAISDAISQVFASLYNDRAISYRVHQGFSHADVALSVTVQKMVRSDCGSSGVMFTLDTESGFDQVVFITSSYGLGEAVVQGAVNPDEFYAYKPALRQQRPAILSKRLGAKAIEMVFGQQTVAGRSVLTQEVAIERRQQFSLSEQHITQLAQYALMIEDHYQCPMDIEWGLDGVDQQIYILQARPETVKSQEKKRGTKLIRFQLEQTPPQPLVTGRAIGQKISTGTVKIIASMTQMDQVAVGDVLVTDMTDPDWEPVMKRASAIVTNRGGRTCHAAIIARELGIPAIVGCAHATEVLHNGQSVTISCAEGDTGRVYDGVLPFLEKHIALDDMPPSAVKISMNVGNPELAFGFSRLPHEGVGLARLEFVISQSIGIHPRCVLDFSTLNAETAQQVKHKTAGYASPREFYVQKIVEAVATISAAFAPKPVIVRFSDFKSNEYSGLIGGKQFEPVEENPMIGFRGASRYLSENFADCFALECEAIVRVRRDMGLKNLWVMVPFVRTLEEAQAVVALLAQHGLKSGEDELKIMMMCEVPANAILADEFLAYFDGFSIGSNDMTQLTLAMDRDSALVAAGFDERDPAVQFMLSRAIAAAKKAGKYIGICGQGPSDHPDLALWLLRQGIGSMSLNPDSVVETWLYLAQQQAAVST